jgi:hypothetical protein
MLKNYLLIKLKVDRIFLEKKALGVSTQTHTCVAHIYLSNLFLVMIFSLTFIICFWNILSNNFKAFIKSSQCQNQFINNKTNLRKVDCH